MVRFRGRGLGEADSVNLMWVTKPKEQEQTPENRRGMSQLKQKERVNSFLFFFDFCSNLGTQWIGWGLSALGMAICFTQFTNANVNLFWNYPWRHTKNNVLPAIWTSLCPVKLTHEINHHKSTPCQFYTYTHLLKPYVTSNKDNNKVLIPPNM